MDGDSQRQTVTVSELRYPLASGDLHRLERELDALPGRDRASRERMLELLRSHVLNDRPVLLLPVRLETHFIGPELWVRIYPDQVFVDAHEPGLTDEEFDAALRYRTAVDAVRGQRGSDAEAKRRGAWRQLAMLFGPARAAWVRAAALQIPDDEESSGQRLVAQRHWAARLGIEESQQTTGPRRYDPRDLSQRRDPRMTKAGLHALPDRFVVYAYASDGHVFRKEGQTIWRKLAWLEAPTPEQKDFFRDKAKWVVDFQQAESDGMAMRITVGDLETGGAGVEDAPSRLPDEFSRIIAVGMRSSTPARGQEVLEELLDGHHYTGGLGFVPQGTPTNNTQLGRSGHSTTDEDREGSYDVEVVGHQSWGRAPPSERRSNAERLGWALGLGTRPEKLRYLAGADDTAESYAGEIQAAMWPSTGGYLLKDLLSGTVGDVDLERVGNHFSRFVRGGGPLPAIRVRDQPYGILPVTCVREKSEQHPRGWVVSAADQSGNDTAISFDVGLHRIMTGLWETWSGWANDPDRIPRVRAGSPDPDRDLLQILGMEPVSISYRARPFVDEAFVAWLLVALRGYAFGQDTPFHELVASPLHWVRKWNRKWKEMRSEAAAYLSGFAGGDPATIEDAPLLRLLGWWKAKDLGVEPAELFPEAQASVPDETPAASVDRMMRQTLDLCTHRLDAWLTSFAAKRLEAMRNRQPTGVFLGAYGWVENLARAKEVSDHRGYIHAPSRGQAAAAAVLHNAYLTHSDGTNANPFRANLSSERVRRALRVIEGIREGQPLGALLGYQLERTLHEGKLDRYIDDLRSAYPLVAGKLPRAEQGAGESAGATAARNVVDGLAVARAARDGKFTSSVLRGANLKDAQAVEWAVNGLLDVLDALGDVLMYEGVFQVVQGNFERGAAALEAASGNAFPPEIQSLKTAPRAATAFEQRVCLLFPSTGDEIRMRPRFRGAQPETAAPGPRTSAEPRLAAWFAGVLGEMTEIACTVQFASERIDVNHATAEELSVLGIELQRAKQIVEYRESEGLFSAVDDLEQVPVLDRVDVEYCRRWAMIGSAVSGDERYYERIDVNVADPDELLIFRDIGPERAALIDESRSKEPFRRLDDLVRVPGISQRTVDRMRPFVTTGMDYVTLAELGIDAVDFLYASTVPPEGGETEIEQRISLFVRREFGLRYDSMVGIDFSRRKDFSYGMGEALELGRQVLDLLGTGSALHPGTLSLPEHAYDSAFNPVDAREIRARLSSRLKHFDQVLDLLQADPAPSRRAILDALFQASQFGVSGAVPPGLDDPDLLDRQQNVLNELRQRRVVYREYQEQIDQGGDPDRQVQLCVKALKALFDNSLVVLPTFVPNRNSDLKQAMVQQALPGQLDPERILLWLQQAACAHPSLRQLEDVMMMAEAWQKARDLSAERSLELCVAQLPHAADHRPVGPEDQWLGLDDEERGAGSAENPSTGANRGALSIVAAVAGSSRDLWDSPGVSDARFAGLLLDQWNERIPVDTLNSSVAFHYDGPNSQAPQCLLLAVPGQREAVATPWEVDDLAAIVGDTLDLAKVRAVDLDAMRGDDVQEDRSQGIGLGLVTPALMFPNRPGWSRDLAIESIEGWMDRLLKPDSVADFKRLGLYKSIGPNITRDDVQFTELGTGSLHIGDFEIFRPPGPGLPDTLWEWRGGVLVSPPTGAEDHGIQVDLPRAVPAADCFFGSTGDPASLNLSVFGQDGQAIEPPDLESIPLGKHYGPVGWSKPDASGKTDTRDASVQGVRLFGPGIKRLVLRSGSEATFALRVISFRE